MSDFDANASPTPGGAPTPAPTPASATPMPSAVPSAIPQGPVAAPTGLSPAAPEDRSNWVPPHRLRETREAAVREAQQRYQQEQAQLQAQVNHYQQQLRALVGAEPPANPDHDAIRQQFGQLYPGLTKIEARAAQLEQYLDQMPDMESVRDYIWQNHGRQAMDRIYSQAAETLGGPLSAEGKRALHAAFTGWVQSSPEYAQRYVDDPSIVDEFWKTLSSTLVDPARRAASAQVASRVPGALPQDTPGGVPSPGPAPKPANMDERIGQMWAGYNANKKV